MGRKKQKAMPNLDEQDLYRVFGVEEESPDFAEELDKNLAAHDLERIIKEKSLSRTRVGSERNKLKNYPSPREQLDLHGLTGPEAEIKTFDFIRAANTLRLRSVRIITGKGLHSDGPAVLPDIIETRLKELRNDGLIFDFRWDKKEKHKSGSVIVYLA